MTLAFMTKWPQKMDHLNGYQTHFPEKIWKSMIHKFDTDQQAVYFAEDYLKEAPLMEIKYPEWNGIHDKTPKKHSIREDGHDRWKDGTNIHFVINDRTPNRFQFAPVLPCVSTQKIEIIWNKPLSELFNTLPGIFALNNGKGNYVCVFIDGKPMSRSIVNQLALNDGFNSIEDFFLWFNTDFNGKIIHWTNLKY